MVSDVDNIKTATMNRKKSSKNGVLLVIMVMVHGDITGRLAKGSVNKSKKRTSQFIFLILPTMQ